MSNPTIDPATVAWFNRFRPFSTRDDHPTIINAMQTVLTLIHDYLKSPFQGYFLTLTGDIGRGKTTLLNRIHDFMTKENGMCPAACTIGRTVSYKRIRWPDLIDLQRNEQNSLIKELQSCSFLIIDEALAKADPWGQDNYKFTSFIDARQDQLCRWTVISTNRSFEEISTNDVRVADRLLRNGSKVIEIDCPRFTPDMFVPKQP